MTWQWPKWPKMVYVIKDTVDIYYFCKNWYESAQEHLLSKLPPVSSKQVDKFLHFSFKTVEKFSNTKPDTLGKESWAETRPTGQWERANPPGSLGGGGGMVRLGINWYISRYPFKFQITYQVPCLCDFRGIRTVSSWGLTKFHIFTYDD